MFGSKKKENEETIERLTADLEKRTEACKAYEEALLTYEGTREDFLRSSERMAEDLNLFSENLDASGALLSDNGKEINALSEQLKQLKESQLQQKEKATDLAAGLEKISEESMNAVENNKHFTAPSKHLSDLSDEFKRGCQEDSRQLKLMAEFSKQMSVLALNAAIEAGRMGESGKEFVTACESVRNYASAYDKAVREMQDRMEKSQKKVAELDEEVRVLINLMKDNNLAVSKIMKNLNDLAKEGRNLAQTDFSEETDQAYAHVEAIWNRESEVDKAEARNRMELDDVKEECSFQKKSMEELNAAFGGVKQQDS